MRHWIDVAASAPAATALFRLQCPESPPAAAPRAEDRADGFPEWSQESIRRVSREKSCPAATTPKENFPCPTTLDAHQTPAQASHDGTADHKYSECRNAG